MNCLNLVSKTNHLAQNQVLGAFFGLQKGGAYPYRFGFNGQMKVNEMSGVGNYLDFTFRGYDSRTGRFYSSDPLHASYPWNSTYAFAENDVIRSIDLEGLEKLTIHTISFAPFNVFGSDLMGTYGGDGNKRKFGDELITKQGSENYRVRSQFDADLNSMTTSDAKPFGAISHYKAKFLRSDKSVMSPARFEEGFSSNNNNGSLNVAYHLAGGNKAAPLGKGADIDVNVQMNFWKAGDKRYGVNFQASGDRFPANENYLVDKIGQKVFLGVSGINSTNKNTAPYTELLLNNNRGMSSSYLYINFNDDDTIKNIEGTDGKTYKPNQWNVQFTNQNPQSSQTGTHVGR